MTVIALRLGASFMEDFHPDPFYKIHSSTEPGISCHRGVGSAGYYGAEVTECDSPYTLVNATFDWIDAELKDSIDFVVWTGDSARHDNDEEIPRSEQQVVEQNEYLVERFVKVFEQDTHGVKSTSDLQIPIIPNFGNNDIMPHNVFSPGPNRWTRKFLGIWKRFIPEEQRHSFERGGWFYVEVIPNQLAAFSLNTLYFFDSNPESNGCGSPSDPGYEQVEWLRIQLQFIRRRGMKAIIIGHVPPARTESKSNWEESCWQKYTLWLRQYRDVVVGSLYGHMNIDHFMLQDSKDVDIVGLQNGALQVKSQRAVMDSHVLLQNAADYLVDLRVGWSKLPDPLKGLAKQRSKRGEKRRQKKYLKEIGGEWAERYMVAHVSPSIIPNYFPSLRIIEYNVTGLDNVNLDARHDSNGQAIHDETIDEDAPATWGRCETSSPDETSKSFPWKWGHKKKRKPRKPKKPHFIIPDPPSKSAPPGPAYSPQTFTWLGFTQYYANLTYFNDEPTTSRLMREPERGSIEDDDSKEFGGRPSGGSSQQKLAEPKPRKLRYEIEYSTFNDKIYNLRDMTVRSYLELAQRIGKYKPKDEDRLDLFTEADDGNDGEDAPDDGDEDEAASIDGAEDHGGSETIARKKKHKKHKGHKRRKKYRGTNNKVWFTFLKRAFVGAKDEEDIQNEYGVVPPGGQSREQASAFELTDEL
ncbi:MAG: Endopolyphosphatase [Peltula sp. TS41687]|nr:MAG: Endopolyphosphatase [Peltula sp. TS41687]